MTTLANVRAALSAHSDSHGADESMTILKSVGGVTALSKLPEDKFAAVIAATSAPRMLAQGGGFDDFGRELSPQDELTRRGLERNDQQKKEWRDRHMPTAPESKDGQK